MENTKWWEPDENDILHIPDELDDVFNRVGTQLRFHTISGKSEPLTVAHIVRNCQEFFGAELQKQKDLNKELVAFIHKLYAPMNNISAFTRLQDEGRALIKKSQV